MTLNGSHLIEEGSLCYVEIRAIFQNIPPLFLALHQMLWMTFGEMYANYIS